MKKVLQLAPLLPRKIEVNAENIMKNAAYFNYWDEFLVVRSPKVDISLLLGVNFP